MVDVARNQVACGTAKGDGQDDTSWIVLVTLVVDWISVLVVSTVVVVAASTSSFILTSTFTRTTTASASTSATLTFTSRTVATRGMAARGMSTLLLTVILHEDAGDLARRDRESLCGNGFQCCGYRCHFNAAIRIVRAQ